MTFSGQRPNGVCPAIMTRRMYIHTIKEQSAVTFDARNHTTAEVDGAQTWLHGTSKNVTKYSGPRKVFTNPPKSTRPCLFVRFVFGYSLG